MSVSAKMYFGDVLYIAISEIAYYRYLLPESFFEEVLFEDLEVHQLMSGKSAKSDMLLEILRGACDALSKNYLETLTFGLSVCPSDSLFIRELYAFKFKMHHGSGNRESGPHDSEFSGKALLFRLVKLLQEMEPLPVLVSLSSRIILTPNAPQDYMPPSFVPLPSAKLSGYSTMPEFGSAQVGIAKRSSIEGYLCVVSVEGPVQQPPLGSMLCSKPMRIDLDDNPDKRVFVAVPNAIVSQDKAITTRQQQKRCLIDCIRQEPAVSSTHDDFHPNTGVVGTENSLSCECQIASCEEMQTCYRCKRKVHTACYVLEGDLAPLVIVCISCQAIDKLATTPSTLYRLALARRAARLAYRQREEQVTWLKKNIGSTEYKGRSIVSTINSLGLIRIDKNVHPNRFSIDENLWQANKAVLFDSDIESAVAATAAVVPRPKP
ncbi:HORMA domain-containing protein [Coemansia mojavensis]|nr:HORMA domain-containing protein [Coemansia mojavensis]